MNKKTPTTGILVALTVFMLLTAATAVEDVLSGRCEQLQTVGAGQVSPAGECLFMIDLKFLRFGFRLSCEDEGTDLTARANAKPAVQTESVQ